MSNHAGSAYTNRMVAGENNSMERKIESKSEASKPEATLNFVFESGSGLRTGGRSVRSQAAKHGWTSRQRATKSDGQSKPKKRKIQHELVFEGQPTPQATPIVTTAGGPTYYPMTKSSSPVQQHVAYGMFHQDLPPSPPVSSPHSLFQSRRSTPVFQSAPQGVPTSRVSPRLPSPPLSFCSTNTVTDICDDDQTPPTPTSSSPPAKRSSAHFLHVVMNEDYPVNAQINDAGDPFSAFPVEWNPFYGWMLENYRAITYKQIREINADPEFGVCVCELPLVTTISESEPALFFALMSTTAIMLTKSGNTLAISPQWFQSKTVETLNAAIADPKRAYSSAAILAVTLIALFESTRGAPELAASFHQPALRKMVDKRGGLDALYSGEPRGPALVRFLVWCDRVISSQSGNPLVFEEWDDETMTATKWDGVWSRMRSHLDKKKIESESESERTGDSTRDVMEVFD